MSTLLGEFGVAVLTFSFSAVSSMRMPAPNADAEDRHVIRDRALQLAALLALVGLERRRGRVRLHVIDAAGGQVVVGFILRRVGLDLSAECRFIYRRNAN